MRLPSPVSDYASLFLNDVPMMDVRAPVEFLQGAFPTATNVPLLDDTQRALIGTEYKRAGQDAAIALGLRLATPDIRLQRLKDWNAFIEMHPNGVLYCFRGGLRSRTAQQWLAEQGVLYRLVKGGYKAMRHFLLEVLEHACLHQPLICISGRTGCGKTEVLQRLPYFIDLEALAHHRGSTFGHTVQSQPSQIDFENALSVALLKHAYAQAQVPLFVEDESHLIGKVALPQGWQRALKSAPRVVIEAPLEERELRVVRDYIVKQRSAFAAAYGEVAAVRFQEFVLHNLDRIRTRLGGARHYKLYNEWREALVHFEATGNPEGFLPGIRQLLVEYYDPMYDYQFSRRESVVRWRGDADGLVAWSLKYAAYPWP